MQAYIHSYFQILIDNGGSDLHLSEGQVPKVRINGEIEPIGDKILDKDTIHKLLAEICDEKNFNDFISSGDLDFAYEMSELARFRCNFFHQENGLGAVFRLIPTKIKTISDLNLPSVIQSLGDLHSGLVLVTGPTGSGKSTTLASLIDYINTNHHHHIVTIEEPIEFIHKNKLSTISQREVPIHCPSFSSGLRATLREDANIVMVGEMRDLETISLALTAAETGLLVFGTLHTNSAMKTVDRLVDAFPSSHQNQARTMLANSLRAVVAQILLKKSDNQGRVAVNEILISNPAVSSIIREGATQKLHDVMLTGRDEGMQLMDDVIWEKMLSNEISPLEAYMKATDKTRFQAALPEEHSQLSSLSQ